MDFCPWRAALLGHCACFPGMNLGMDVLVLQSDPRLWIISDLQVKSSWPGKGLSWGLFLCREHSLFWEADGQSGGSDIVADLLRDPGK